MRERAYDRHEKNDDYRVDCGKLADRSVEAELANAPLREHVVHLEKNGFEESDEEEESKQPVEGRLTNQAPKKLRGSDRAFSHRLSDAGPKGGRGPAIAGRVINRGAAVVCFCSPANKIDYRKQHDFEHQTNHEQLLI